MNLVRYLMHALHDRLCPCRSVINSYWDCGDCGALNHPRHDWCQSPECRAHRREEARRG